MNLAGRHSLVLTLKVWSDNLVIQNDITFHDEQMANIAIIFLKSK